MRILCTGFADYFAERCCCSIATQPECFAQRGWLAHYKGQKPCKTGTGDRHFSEFAAKKRLDGQDLSSERTGLLSPGLKGGGVHFEIAMQVFKRFARLDTQFLLESFSAQLILTQRGPTLCLAQIAEHDIIVGIFPAIIESENTAPVMDTLIICLILPGKLGQMMMRVQIERA